jgi:hypothetical protein
MTLIKNIISRQFDDFFGDADKQCRKRKKE